MKTLSLLQRFSLLSLAAFLGVGLALGTVATFSIEKSAVDRSKNETAHFIAAEVERVFGGVDFNSPMTGSRYEDFSKGISHLKSNPSIKRIKVWNLEKIVVWSDERQLVGKQFPDEKELQEALNGTISSEIISPSKSKDENRTERQFSRFLELYVPIRSEHEGKVRAVFEIYQDLESLDADTSRQKRILWIAILAGFSVVYFACFGIVLRASRRLAEQTLEVEKSEETYRDQATRLTSLINNVPGIVYRGYPDWSLSFIGAEVETGTGYTPDEFVSGAARWQEIIFPDDLERVKEVFRKAVKEKSDALHVEYRIRHKDGGIRWLADRRQLIYDAGGGFAYVDGLLLDITDRRHSDEELRSANEKFQAVIEASPLAIVSLTPEGNITMWNPAAERMTGWSEEETLGRPLPIVPEEKKGEFQTLLARGRRDESLSGVEVRRQKKDGTPIDISIWTSPMRDHRGEVAGVMSVWADVTERKKMAEALRRSEEQLRQSQKMETVGRLAGGIAHDFNNLLTAIEGYSDLLLSRLGENNPLSDDVREIRKAGDRASALTRQLLAFSRMQVLQPKVLDLNDVVANMEKMVTRLIGDNVHLVTIPGENLGRVKADKGQIEQVLLNLVVNARDAMTNGGRIIVETSNVELDNSFATKQVAFRPGPYVMLTVTDTGSGMDEKTMSRIFEPFFTTKEQGKGTGLGLATVYGIVKQSNGYIWVYSEPGHGTTFKIHLPRVDEEAEEEAAAPRPLVPARAAGTETILVVEDTELVRILVKEVLTRSGYAVLEATNGEEALLICRQREEPIHLLLTDMMMPKMSGAELAGTISSFRSGIKVLYMSGYTEYGSADNAGLRIGSFFIQKPFSVAALTEKVREVLES